MAALFIAAIGAAITAHLCREANHRHTALTDKDPS